LPSRKHKHQKHNSSEFRLKRGEMSNDINKAMKSTQKLVEKYLQATDTFIKINTDLLKAFDEIEIRREEGVIKIQVSSFNLWNEQRKRVLQAEKALTELSFNQDNK